MCAVRGGKLFRPWMRINKPMSHNEGGFFLPKKTVYYKYIRPRNTQKKMYASLVACCPLLNHVEYDCAARRGQGNI